MYQYLVYLYMANQPIKRVDCTTREEANILKEVAKEDGYYKYQLVVRDTILDMPIETQTEYINAYKVVDSRKPRKRKR